jgi:hypothetical protein
VLAARRALLAEVQPIDDIRSTAEYRRRVAVNLLEEFLLEVAPGGIAAVNATLAAWNARPDEADGPRMPCWRVAGLSVGPMPW